MDLKSYLVGKHGGAYTASLHLPSYLIGRAKSSDIQEITGTLPLAVRSRASQVLENYIIYGESIQDGTPTPDNPVELTGLGVRTVNLYDAVNIGEGYIRSRALDANGNTYMPSGASYYSVSYYIPVLSERIYTLVMNATSQMTDMSMCFYDYAKNFVSGLAYGTPFSNKTFTTPPDCVYMRFTVRNVVVNSIMIVEGSTPPDHYIPYGYKLPIKVTSNDTTTDYPIYIGDSQLMRIPNTEYADFVDYEKGKIVRRVKKLVLTGEEDFVYQKYTYSYTYVLDIPDISLQTIRVLSTHFRGVDSLPGVYLRTGKIFTTLARGYIHSAIGIGDNWSGSENAFKTFLADQYAAGTPVTVWYALATPVEEDPPLPFPDITIPKGEVTIDIDGELKPQATIKGLIKQI